MRNFYVLQCVTVCHSVLQCTYFAVCVAPANEGQSFSMIQCVVMRYSVLQRVLFYNVFPCVLHLMMRVLSKGLEVFMLDARDLFCLGLLLLLLQVVKTQPITGLRG